MVGGRAGLRGGLGGEGHFGVRGVEMVFGDVVGWEGCKGYFLYNRFDDCMMAVHLACRLLYLYYIIFC